MAQDAKIEAHNKKLRNASEALERARVTVGQRAEALHRADVARRAELTTALSKAQAAEETSRDRYTKVIATGKDFSTDRLGKSNDINAARSDACVTFSYQYIVMMYPKVDIL